MADSTPLARPGRPVLDGAMRSKSFLEQMQQYRPPQNDGHQGIDSLIEDLSVSGSPDKSASSFKGVPSPHSPPRVVDGVNHSLSHANCQPESGKSDRIVATLFYKYKNSPRVSNANGQPASSPSPASSTLPDGLAPTRSLSTFPLEPPPPDPEPLDHLYGSYISPICITSFLALVNSLPLPAGTTHINSSHRCLDSTSHPLVVELTISPAPDPQYVTLSDLRRHELLYRFSLEWNVDIILQSDSVSRRYPRLVVFDMDSTLIEQEVIDLIAASIGVEDKVSAITMRAMNGELDFAASLRERVALLKGVNADIFEKLRTVITPTQGAREVIQALKRMGVKTAVLSGGFIPLTQWLADELGIDYAYANTLTVDEATSTLTGEVSGTIVDAARKRDLLLEIAQKEKIDPRQTIAVGDGANDLLMMGAAGLGVAFRAKPRVQLEAEARLNGDSLLDLMYVFGFTREEVMELVAGTA